jgi:phage terminase large subunit
MAGTLTPTPYQTVLDADGVSVSGALIYTYTGGTTTLASTYTTSALTVANANPIVADSARPETISHMRRNGFPKIMPAVKGPRSLEEGVEWLKSYDIVVHPRCVHTIDELTLYSYKTDALTGNILPVLEDKKNHVIDALRYACEGIRRTASAKPASVVAIPCANRW